MQSESADVFQSLPQTEGISAQSGTIHRLRRRARRRQELRRTHESELLCLRYDGIQVLFMRRTYPELKENHLLPAMRELNGVAKYNGTDKALSFPTGTAQSSATAA